MTPAFFTSSANVTADEFQQFLPVNVNFSFDTIAPALYDAEQKYIYPMVGSSLWAQLVAYYQTPEPTNAIKQLLIERIQSAVLRIAYFESFDLFAVQLTDSGIENPFGDKSAYRYQVDAARDTLGRQAFEHLQMFYDALIASNLVTWSDSDPNCPYRRNSLFRDANEFFAVTEMQPDFRLFNKLRGSVSLAEKIDLPFRIGQTLAQGIITHSETRFTDATFLTLARRFVAYKVLDDSVMMLHAFINDYGVTTRTFKAEGSTGGSTQQTADVRTRQALRQQYANAAEQAITQLIVYLQANADTYPELASVITDKPQVHTPINSNNHTFRV